MNAFEFSREAIRLCSEFSFIIGVEILLIDEPVAKIKAVMEEDTFINVFYNAETSKYSFALIKTTKESLELIIQKGGTYISLKILNPIQRQQ